MSQLVKQEEWKKLHKITKEFEIEKKKLLDEYEEEIKKKENYYLSKIDSLSEKLEDVGELLQSLYS